LSLPTSRPFRAPKRPGRISGALHPLLEGLPRSSGLSIPSPHPRYSTFRVHPCLMRALISNRRLWCTCRSSVHGPKPGIQFPASAYRRRRFARTDNDPPLSLCRRLHMPPRHRACGFKSSYHSLEFPSAWFSGIIEFTSLFRRRCNSALKVNQKITPHWPTPSSTDTPAPPTPPTRNPDERPTGTPPLLKVNAPAMTITCAPAPLASQNRMPSPDRSGSKILVDLAYQLWPPVEGRLELGDLGWRRLDHL
jgi:hypothetical protein